MSCQFAAVSLPWSQATDGSIMPSDCREARTRLPSGCRAGATSLGWALGRFASSANSKPGARTAQAGRGPEAWPAAGTSAKRSGTAQVRRYARRGSRRARARGKTGRGQRGDHRGAGTTGPGLGDNRRSREKKRNTQAGTNSRRFGGSASTRGWPDHGRGR